jgi:hypothetical protein
MCPNLSHYLWKSKSFVVAQKIKKETIKRDDGSYSRRGLWDNIRANKGSGKPPTKEMIAQERKIKKQKK